MCVSVEGWKALTKYIVCRRWNYNLFDFNLINIYLFTYIFIIHYVLKNPFAPIIVHAKYDINYNRIEQKMKLTDQGFI